MNISDAAKYSGLSAKTIRYYESIRLISAATRGGNGYREYNEKELGVLLFLCRARSTGFSVEECRQLLALYQDPSRQSAEVKSLVLEKVKKVDRQLKELQLMRDTLMQMAEQCADNQEPRCAIIDQLADQQQKPS